METTGCVTDTISANISICNNSHNGEHVSNNFQPPTEVVIATAIQNNYLKVLCAVGLPGNVAAIITIATVKPLSAATFLVALLAVSDSLALIIKLLFNQLYLFLDPFTDGFCRSLPLANVCSSFANWVLVLITFERLIAVVMPLMRFRFLSKTRVYCICVALALLISAVHAPNIVSGVALWRFGCGVTEGVQDYETHTWVWLNTAIYALMPLLLLIIINTALCLALNFARRRRESLLGSATVYSSAQARRDAQRAEWAITAMVLAASVLFVLMILPQCLYFVLFYHTDVFADLRHSPKDMLIRQCVTLIADTTHALNFYIYFISVKRFRLRFLTIVQCQGGLCKSPGRSPLHTSFSSRSTVRESISLNGVHYVGKGKSATSVQQQAAKDSEQGRQQNSPPVYDEKIPLKADV